MSNDYDTLEYSPTSCWERYAAPEEREAMDSMAARYLSFLSTCKTEREVVDYAVLEARKAGFVEDLSEEASDERIMRVFKGKTLFLARRGSRPLSQGFRLLGAHGDSPRLDFKQRAIYEDCHVSQAKTHYYGGIRKHQWLARPLALHGVVVKADGQSVRVVIGEEPDEPVFMVPDLLPHLAQDQNEKKLSKAFEAEKLNILLGHEPFAVKDEANDKESANGKENGKPKNPVKRHVLEILHKKYGIVEEDLYSAELQAVPAGPARYVGLDRACIGGYGQDDRICVFAGLEALFGQQDPPEHTQILVIWDKEEIGSDGNTGAKSLFFEYCLDELLQAWEPGTRRREAMLAAKAISTDVHGALDPDYQELHEKLNAALLGHGPVFSKFTGSRGKLMANDAHPEYVAWLRGVLARAGVPWQMAELGKVDQGGGGTVAKHLAVYGMDIIDFGPPVLSMHSPFELCSKADLYATVQAFGAFLRS